MTIGNQIREQRLLNRWTQKELATQLGLTPKMISFYENNERIPPADILVRLSQIFQVTTDYLLGLSQEPSSMSARKKTTLNDEEYAIITIYRRLEQDYRDIIYGRIKEMSKLQDFEQKNKNPSYQKKQA